MKRLLRTWISISAVSIPSRVTISTVKKKTPAIGEEARGRGRVGVEPALHVALHPRRDAPDVHDERGHEHRGDDAEDAFDQRLMLADRASTRSRGAKLAAMEVTMPA